MLCAVLLFLFLCLRCCKWEKPLIGGFIYFFITLNFIFLVENFRYSSYISDLFCFLLSLFYVVMMNVIFFLISFSPYTYEDERNERKEFEG